MMEHKILVRLETQPHWRSHVLEAMARHAMRAQETLGALEKVPC